jgi:hypothetical protein
MYFYCYVMYSCCYVCSVLCILFHCVVLCTVCVKRKGKVPHWGTSAPQPQGLLCSNPEGVPSFISRGAAHRTVCCASISEGKNYVKGI